jgi:hypothetical protein
MYTQLLTASNQLHTLKPRNSSNSNASKYAWKTRSCSNLVQAGLAHDARHNRPLSSGLHTRAATAAWSSKTPQTIHADKSSEDDGGTTQVRRHPTSWLLHPGSNQVATIQITALLVLSLTLLSLPWAIEHPGVLFVPLALAVLPGVGPTFVQPVLCQALTWAINCCQWIPRAARDSVFRARNQQQHAPRRRHVEVAPVQRTDSRLRAAAADPRAPPASRAQHNHHVDLMENFEQL